MYDAMPSLQEAIAAFQKLDQELYDWIDGRGERDRLEDLLDEWAEAREVVYYLVEEARRKAQKAEAEFIAELEGQVEAVANKKSGTL